MSLDVVRFHMCEVLMQQQSGSSHMTSAKTCIFHNVTFRLLTFLALYIRIVDKLGNLTILSLFLLCGRRVWKPPREERVKEREGEGGIPSEN